MQSPATLPTMLRDARIAAVLLHTTKGNTYSHFTAEVCGADACTLELGKVRPFGQNDLARFASADAALRQLIAGEPGDSRAQPLLDAGAGDATAPASTNLYAADPRSDEVHDDPRDEP